jgi:hypothetical protein
VAERVSTHEGHNRACKHFDVAEHAKPMGNGRRRRDTRGLHLINVSHRAPYGSPQSQRSAGAWTLVHNNLLNGQSFRTVTVLDQRSRQRPLFGVRLVKSGLMVGELFERYVVERSATASKTVNHGPELVDAQSLYSASEANAGVYALEIDLLNRLITEPNHSTETPAADPR